MPAKVYYNSACPVCRAGIRDQRQRMEACGIDTVEWIDVHQQPERVEEVGASLEQVRERLYVRNTDGSLAVGADAFESLWAVTPRQRWAAKLVRLPGVKGLARIAYNLFARLLYRWNRSKGHW